MLCESDWCVYHDEYTTTCKLRNCVFNEKQEELREFRKNLKKIKTFLKEENK